MNAENPNEREAALRQRLAAADGRAQRLTALAVAERGLKPLERLGADLDEAVATLARATSEIETVCAELRATFKSGTDAASPSAAAFCTAVSGVPHAELLCHIARAVPETVHRFGVAAPSTADRSLAAAMADVVAHGRRAIERAKLAALGEDKEVIS